MTTPQMRRFDAHLDAFAELREFVERCCADLGVGQRTTDVLMLIFEELFENTRNHGYQALPDGALERPIWLSMAVIGGCIDAVYEDAAPAYDPFANVSPPDYSGPAETWRVGGLGIPLVPRLTRDLRYARSGERNRISFSVPVDGVVS